MMVQGEILPWPHLNQYLDVVMHAYQPATWEAQIKGSQPRPIQAYETLF
jgi:hypothetical protein